MHVTQGLRFLLAGVSRASHRFRVQASLYHPSQSERINRIMGMSSGAVCAGRIVWACWLTSGLGVPILERYDLRNHFRVATRPTKGEQLRRGAHEHGCQQDNPERRRHC